jgi:transposase InsO family protein
VINELYRGERFFSTIYERYGLRVLADRGTEYCGNREHHAYQLYLAVENIDHSKIKVKSPQQNGIVERIFDISESAAPFKYFSMSAPVSEKKPTLVRFRYYSSLAIEPGFAGVISSPSAAA